MKNTQNQIKQLLSDADKYKPAGYISNVSMLRDLYKRREIKHVKAEMKKRYPNTFEEMPAYSVGLYRHLIEQMASIYKVPPSRRILTNGTEDLTASSRLDNLYTMSYVDSALQRLEEISAACGVGFLRIWLDNDNVLKLQPYWPDRIWVIPNERMPSDLSKSYALVAQISGKSGANHYSHHAEYEVWSRIDDGWTMHLLSTDGSHDPKLFDDAVVYPNLPWLAFHYTESDTMFPHPPEDDAQVSIQQSLLASDLLYTISHQAFDHLVYTGDTPPTDMVMGPGRILNAGGDGDLKSISFNPSIAPVLDVIKELSSQHLLLNGVSPSTATADPKYQSSLALKVANQPMIEKRNRRAPIVRKFETELCNLCSVLLPDIFPATDWELKWNPGTLEEITDPMTEMNLSKEYLELGMSTKAREMVRLGIYDDEMQAELVLNEIAITEKTLNGAQITAITDIITKVTEGTIPKEAAIELVLQSTPSFSRDAVEQMFLSVKPKDNPSLDEIILDSKQND